MKYQVGDEILVIHSNEEGRIIEIMNDKMVMIEVRGVKFPAYKTIVKKMKEFGCI